MSDLSVADKKQIIHRLDAAYRATSLPVNTARQMESGLMARIEANENRWRVPRWVPVVAGVGVVLIAALLLVIISPTSDSASMMTAEVSNVRGNATYGAGQVLTSEVKIKQGEFLQTRAASQLTIALGRHQIEMTENSGLQLTQLKRDQLIFHVNRGRTRFKVSKLTANESLQVRSGNVTVHVVGTQFSVAKDGGCVEVGVSEGKVKTVFAETVGFVAAGQKRRFCEHSGEQKRTVHKKAPPVSQLVGTEDAQQERPADAKAGVFKRNSKDDTDILGIEPIPAPATSRIAAENSDEVLLFDNAHKALTRGALSTASKLFQDYLKTYPRGLFSEDAAFRLVRIAFRQGGTASVMRWSNRFLQQYGNAPGHRLAEVRILQARTLMNQHQFQLALDALAPLTRRFSNQTPRHRHQITALQLTASCDTGVSAACQQWANRYLASWPDGPFAEKAKTSLKK